MIASVNFTGDKPLYKIRWQVCVYVLVAILKKELQLPQSLHSILHILSVSTVEKVTINQLLTTIFVLVTLRSDFYSQIQQLPAFVDLKDADRQFDLRAQPAEIAQMIRQLAIAED